MKKPLFFLRKLLETFWFVPSILIFLAVICAASFVYLDSLLTIPVEGWGRIFLVNHPDSARAILSTISGAMIGVAGTVFSVTLVALTLASSQFGPRLIKNFMYVRLNQVVLGSYVSTYLYCLLVLTTIKGSEDYNFIPSLSILIAIVIAAANIILLILFIHQIATSIQAGHVIADISNFISRQVETLFPDKIGAEKETVENINLDNHYDAYDHQKAFKATKSGYLQYVDGETLTELLSEYNVLLKLNRRPGSYLVQGEAMGYLYTNITLDDDLLTSLSNQFIIGSAKTAEQDLEFSIHQMVEIAVRALSPGVNDPYTAITCIDHLSSTMSYMAQAKFPSKYRFDENEHLRVITDNLEFAGMLDASFNQIRQFSRGSAAVIIRLMEALITIESFTTKANDKNAVKKHAKMVLTLGERSIDEANDFEDLKARAEKILKS